MTSVDAPHDVRHWVDRYTEIVPAMYALRHLCPRRALLATSCVSPRHQLPDEHLSLATALSVGVRSARGAARRNMLANVMWSVLLTLHDTFWIAWLKVEFGSRVRKLVQTPAAVVMKTWCPGPESVNPASDFYYGDMVERLRERGVNTVLLCGNARRGSHRAFARAVLARGDGRCVPEWVLVPLWAPLITLWDQLVTRMRLRRIADRVTDPTLALVAHWASVECLEPATHRRARYFYIARRAVERWRPRAFIALYEGQPWEILARHGVKAASPGCVTVGYQHTVIMPHSFSLLRPHAGSWELSAPEVVLCLGEVTKAMMEPGHAPHRARLVPFGSFRRAPGSAAPASPRPGRRTVLVLPEGIRSEAILLFNFATRAARALPDHHFVFRCHPVLPFAQVRPDLEGAPEASPNIEVSQGAIAEDFARCSTVLYRGSSAALYAVLQGLKPVYLRDDRFSHIDPLFELTVWREQVVSVADLGVVLARYAAVPDADAENEWKPAREYVDAYTVPVDRASVDRLLAAAGLSAPRPEA